MLQCQRGMSLKKKMKIKMNKQLIKDRDGFDSRLLLFLKKEARLSSVQMNLIKQGVWKLKSSDQRWIVKEFPSSQRFESQSELISKLFAKGFFHTYRFHQLHGHGPLIFENRIFALLEYIEHDHIRIFNYEHKKNRMDALAVLQKFHRTTSEFTDPLQHQIPSFDQLLKWENRLNEYKQRIENIKSDPIFTFLQYYMELGEWTLRKLRRNPDYFLDRPHCIIHGDLAHHNFIRGKNGKLHLIDFDLISRAPAHIDLLQFCNRILPNIGWSYDQLFSHRELYLLQRDKPFLEALVFPTDIFREWNYFLKGNADQQKRNWSYINKLTKAQLQDRIKFNKSVMRKIDNL